MLKLKTKIIFMNVSISIFVAVVIFLSCMVDLRNKNMETINQYEEIMREQYDKYIKFQDMMKVFSFLGVTFSLFLY